MKIQDYTEPMKQLLADTMYSAKNLESNDCQPARRAFVRSVLVYIEGSIWILKKTCIQAKGSARHCIPELMCLIEGSAEIASNGSVKIRPMFVKTADNLRFVVFMLRKYFSIQYDLGVGTKPWTEFVDSIKIRNRITHPKSLSDLTITDMEIEQVKRVSSWYNAMIFYITSNLPREKPTIGGQVIAADSPPLG